MSKHKHIISEYKWDRFIQLPPGNMQAIPLVAVVLHQLPLEQTNENLPPLNELKVMNQENTN